MSKEKYAIKRMGQGYHDSGDQLNVSTREVLAGIDRAAKIIECHPYAKAIERCIQGWCS